MGDLYETRLSTTCVKECFGLCIVLVRPLLVERSGRALLGFLSVFHVIKGWVGGLGVILCLLVLSKRKNYLLPQPVAW